MDEKHKPTVFALSFLAFILIAALIIGGLRGEITGGVTADRCIIECYSNENCDDGNECTLDGCAYPGTCAARCTYTKKDRCE